MTKALLIIDMQQAFELKSWGERNNPEAEANALELLRYFRKAEYPVLHVQHISHHPESRFYLQSSRSQFKKDFEPLEHEPVFKKSVNSAFIGTHLESYLREHQIKTLVICGLTLPHCVSTTTHMAANLGFDSVVISDATASFALPDLDGNLLAPELLHQVHLASLQDEFATVISTKDYLLLNENKN